MVIGFIWIFSSLSLCFVWCRQMFVSCTLWMPMSCFMYINCLFTLVFFPRPRTQYEQQSGQYQQHEDRKWKGFAQLLGSKSHSQCKCHSNGQTSKFLFSFKIFIPFCNMSFLFSLIFSTGIIRNLIFNWLSKL